MATVCGRSCAGTTKSVNQDAHCILSAETSLGEAVLVAVCDGVGGLSCGELASSFAVREIARWFEESLPGYLGSNVRDGVLDLSNIEGAWTVLLEDVNARIRRHGQSVNAYMGTTATVLLVIGGRFAIAHVGDCRAYRFRGGAHELLTRDQTLIQREVESGRISAEAALTHPRGSVILQALGAQEGIDPAFYFGDARDGDMFLVACDGFYRRLDVDGLDVRLARLGQASEEALGAVLADAVEQVAAKGEKDNVTAVLLQLELPDSATTVLSSDDEVTEHLPGEPAFAPTDEDEPTCVIAGGE